MYVRVITPGGAFFPTIGKLYRFCHGALPEKNKIDMFYRSDYLFFFEQLSNGSMALKAS
jgi:hypothetical protein